jgi:anaerobic magnesium-protoporphyrin IX monomethyl ester cyclase
MRFKKVLLVRPNYRESHYEYAGLPTGLGYISEALSASGIEHMVFDMCLGYSDQDLLKTINSFKPDLVGISMMSFKYRDHYALADKIRIACKGCAVVAGGPHVSTFRDLVLNDCKSIDYGITLEGEDALIELCRDEMEHKDIKGLIYRDGGNVLYSGDRGFRTDLDGISFPKYKKFETGKYTRFVSLVTSRGCPHNCIFCPVQLTIGRRLRVRSPASVVDEIEYWQKEGFCVFNVVDDNFTFDKKRILDICGDIKRRGLKGLTFSCRNGVRADTVDREMLQAMKDVGFNYLAFGIESGSDKILKVLRKGETLSDMENAVKDACDLGYMVTLFFIVGLPHETEDDVAESLDFAMKFPVFDVRFYNPIPFPGTDLYRWVKEKGYFCEPNADYLNDASHWVNSPVFYTPELPVDVRVKLYKELNKKVTRHTLKIKLRFSSETEKLFTNLGIPSFIGKLLARLYYTELFQSVFVESGIGARIGKAIKIR